MIMIFIITGEPIHTASKQWHRSPPVILISEAPKIFCCWLPRETLFSEVALID